MWKKLWRWLLTSGRDEGIWKIVEEVCQWFGLRGLISGLVGSIVVPFFAWTPPLDAPMLILWVVGSFGVFGLSGTLCLRFLDNFSASETVSNKPEPQETANPEITQRKSVGDLAEIGGDRIRIQEMSHGNELILRAWNRTGRALKCAFWVTHLREWTEDLGYLRKSKAEQLIPHPLFPHDIIIEPKEKMKPTPRLALKEKDRLCISGLNEQRRDDPQYFTSAQPDSYWSLTVEVRMKTEVVTRKNIFFRCPQDKTIIMISETDHDIGRETKQQS
jgi:hypothetical protein